MLDNLKNEQINQELEYWFPYHYIAKFKNNNFRHFFLDTWAINYASTIEFILKKINSDYNSQIVDIGCGDGRLTRELSIAYNNSSITGIDYSKHAIALAKAMNSDIKNIKFRALDITKKHTLGLFDIALLIEVFEHIPVENTYSFMTGVRNLLREGGILYLTVPHQNKQIDNKHFQHFTVETITNYLLPFFEIIEVITFERISWKRKLILLVLSNKWFILNNSTLLSFIYRWYKKYLFYCSSEKECQRIFIKAIAKK